MGVFGRLSGGIVPGDTISAILDRHKGMGPGFELLRMALALAVLASHLSWLTGTNAHDGVMAVRTAAKLTNDAVSTRFFYAPMYGTGAFYQLIRLILVPMFFALSGFLVTGSALRLRNVPTFLAFRALRILPALSVEVTLSSLVLGPLMTVLPLGLYFTDPLFRSYFLNIIGDVHYLLPGLFVNNPVRLVNGNLWTLPAEFLCYAAMAVVMVSKILFNRILLTYVFIAATLILAGLNFFTSFDSGYDAVNPHALAMFFLAGVVLYQWRDRCPIRFDLLLVAVLAMIVTISSPRLFYLTPLPMIYCTAFIGMCRFPDIRLISSGDYSYGIYLYGAPIAQALIFVVPGFRAHPLLLLGPAVAGAYVFAAFSWHYIEKPALKLKTHLPERFFPRAPKIVPASVGIVTV